MNYARAMAKKELNVGIWRPSHFLRWFGSLSVRKTVQKNFKKIRKALFQHIAFVQDDEVQGIAAVDVGPPVEIKLRNGFWVIPLIPNRNQEFQTKAGNVIHEIAHEVADMLHSDVPGGFNGGYGIGHAGNLALQHPEAAANSATNYQYSAEDTYR